MYLFEQGKSISGLNPGEPMLVARRVGGVNASARFLDFRSKYG
jgi:hypothetical protein